MNRILATLAACTLLFHAAIGCCWHHQHVAAQVEASEAQVLPIVCGGHAHSHHGHRHDHDAAPTEHEHRHSDDGCGEKSCQFVKSDAGASLSLLDGAMLATTPAVDATITSAGRFANRDRRSSHILEGVPLHLRHQVLVI